MSHHLAGVGKADPDVTRARRLRFLRWRDPRLIIGILLVTTAVVAGSIVFAESDNTVEYWTLSDDVEAGALVDESALGTISVRLGSEARDHYLRVEDSLPGQFGELVWTRDAGRGELIGRSAMSPADEVGAELPLNVPQGAFPDDLAIGDRVDVWVGPAVDQTGGDAERVLADVTVLSTGAGSNAVGGSLASTIVVAIEPAQVQPDVVTAISSGRVTLVRLP